MYRREQQLVRDGSRRGETWSGGLLSGVHPGRRGGADRVPADFQHRAQISVADLIGFGGERAKAFNIIIQLAAILAVVWEFRGKIFRVVRDLPSQRQARRFTANLLIAFFPAVVLGVLFADLIHGGCSIRSPSPWRWWWAGVVMLWAERRKHVIRAEHVDDMTWKDALKIGRAQCLAMIPGTSRSGATIIGGLLFGLSRRAATEFSFLPGDADHGRRGGLSGYVYRDLNAPEDLPVFAVGFVTSFVFAMLAVRALLKFIGNHSYAAFAWYRIAFGLLILATWQFHLIDWSTAGEV
ncbi:undecaprenyl-diphosphate phosphatase [Pseudomonas aeruginosa]